jgi:predicted kinase
MLEKTTEEYIDAYLATIPLPKVSHTPLFAVGMVALPGTGKSTFASALASELGLYVASNDRIRRWLNEEQGIPGDAPHQELLQAIAEASSKYLFKNNISHILDNDLVKFHELARLNARDGGAEFFLFHLEAPEAVILERLSIRQVDITSGSSANLSRAGADEYYRRKQVHQELGLPSRIDLTIDASLPVATEVNAAVNYLRSRGVVS